MQEIRARYRSGETGVGKQFVESMEKLKEGLNNMGTKKLPQNILIPLNTLSTMGIGLKGGTPSTGAYSVDINVARNFGDSLDYVDKHDNNFPSFQNLPIGDKSFERFDYITELINNQLCNNQLYG